MEALNGVAVIGPVAIILAERHGVRHFVRLAVESRRAAEFGTNRTNSAWNAATVDGPSANDACGRRR
jgi:hypothetical protein